MPHETDEIKQQIQEFVAGNRISKAINALIEYFTNNGDEQRHQAAIKLSAQYNRINKKLNLSEITQEKADVGISKIINAILKIFDEIPIFDADEDHETHRQLASESKDRFGQRIIQISSLLIILFLIIGIGLSIYMQGFDPIIKAVQASLFVVGASMVAFGLLFMVKKYILD